MSPLPYWPLAWFYLFYFAHLGAYGPYFSLYLDAVGLSPAQIGIVMSLPQLVRIVAPHGWGWLADRAPGRVAIARAGATAGLVAFCGLLAGTSFAWICAVVIVTSVFTSGAMPIMEATTLAHIGADTGRYGRIRVWGSIGYIAAVIGVGAMLDHVPVSWLSWTVIALLAVSVASMYAVPEPGRSRRPGDEGRIGAILRRPEVVALIVACALMAVAHGPYYAFLSLHLVDLGYSKTAVGWLWSVGVIAEIAVFMWMPRLFAALSIRTVLVASFAVAAVRFVLIAWLADVVPVLFVAQVMHAASFGSFHAGALAAMHRLFPGSHQARGQAIYSSLTFGAGGALGGLYSGVSWQAWGPGATFTIAAACAAAGALLLAWKLRLEGSRED